jgi:hypothetical protein
MSGGGTGLMSGGGLSMGSGGRGKGDGDGCSIIAVNVATMRPPYAVRRPEGLRHCRLMKRR